MADKGRALQVSAASLFEIAPLLGVEPRALCLLGECPQPVFILILRMDLNKVSQGGLELMIL